MMSNRVSGLGPGPVTFRVRCPGMPDGGDLSVRRGGLLKWLTALAIGGPILAAPAMAAQSLWSTSDVPAVIIDSDTVAVELG